MHTHTYISQRQSSYTWVHHTYTHVHIHRDTRSTHIHPLQNPHIHHTHIPHTYIAHTHSPHTPTDTQTRKLVFYICVSTSQFLICNHFHSSPSRLAPLFFGWLLTSFIMFILFSNTSCFSSYHYLWRSSDEIQHCCSLQTCPITLSWDT